MMVTAGFIGALALGLQIMGMTTEGAAVTSAPKIRPDAQPINMTFLVQTLNQAFNAHGVSPIQTDGRNVQEKVKMVIRQEMETFTAALYQRMTEVCHQKESALRKADGDDGDTVADRITEAVNRTTQELGRSLEKTREMMQEHLTNLQTNLMKTIREARHDNRRLLQDIDRIGLFLNESDSDCEAGSFFYKNQSESCGTCYTFDLVLRTWKDARSYCQGRGADLVSVETAEENAFLTRIILRNKDHPFIKARGRYFGYWASGSDKESEGNWVWKATGSALVYKNWQSEQPSNYKNQEHWLSILANDGAWNDIHDTQPIFAICEKASVC